MGEEPAVTRPHVGANHHIHTGPISLQKVTTARRRRRQAQAQEQRAAKTGVGYTLESAEAVEMVASHQRLPPLSHPLRPLRLVQPMYS